MTDSQEGEKKTRRRRGAGVLHQRADGLWVGRLELPPDPRTGKRRHKYVYSKSQTLAEQKLNKEFVRLANNGDIPTGSQNVSKWMAYWIDNINTSRPTTRAGYRSKIKYIDQAIGKVKLDKLTPADVRKLEKHITGTLGRSSTSARQTYAILSRALTDAEREGRVVRNVAKLVNAPVRAATNTKVLSTAEAVAVIRTAREDRLASRWAAALLTGARQGELLGLEIDRVGDDYLDLSWQLQRVAWQHGCDAPEKCAKRGTDCPNRKIDAPANWEHRHLTGALYLSRPKSRAGWRVVPLVDPLRSMIHDRIRTARNEPNPYGLVWTADPKRSNATREILPIDGSPIDAGADNKAWHALLQRAKATDVRLHDARHTAVTLLYDLGVSESVIQAIVGQSVVSVTRGYRHMNRGPLIEAMTKLAGEIGS